jgi:hypothetical protein
VTFSEAVNGVTTAGNVRLLNGATVVASTVAFNTATLVATITPTVLLTNDTRYTVQLSGITDLSGNALAAGSTTATFLTGPAPTVTARTPAVNATGVSRVANITATFSENMNAATVTTATVTLRLGTGNGGTLIASAITYNPATRVVTVNPTPTLNANTVYTARLLTGLTDAAGNPLAAVTWSFTTGA